MSEYRAKTGRYNLRVVILRRAAGAKQPNGEIAETWPDPDPGTSEYFAARESLSAGETITQGVRNATGTLKLRVKGRNIAVDARDRLKVKHSGEVFEVTALSRDEAETVLTAERLKPQSVQQ